MYVLLCEMGGGGRGGGGLRSPHLHAGAASVGAASLREEAQALQLRRCLLDVKGHLHPMGRERARGGGRGAMGPRTHRNQSSGRARTQRSSHDLPQPRIIPLGLRVQGMSSTAPLRQRSFGLPVVRLDSLLDGCSVAFFARGQGSDGAPAAVAAATQG